MYSPKTSELIINAKKWMRNYSPNGIFIIEARPYCIWSRGDKTQVIMSGCSSARLSL